MAILEINNLYFKSFAYRNVYKQHVHEAPLKVKA